MNFDRTVPARLELTLDETKTRIVDARREGFDFLGFRFQPRRSRRSGKLYPHVEPSRRAIQRIKDRAKALTDRRRTPVKIIDTGHRCRSPDDGGAEPHATRLECLFPLPQQLECLLQRENARTADDGALAIGACFAVKDIGKPFTGERYARFDEGGLAILIWTDY